MTEYHNIKNMWEGVTWLGRKKKLQVWDKHGYLKNSTEKVNVILQFYPEEIK